MRRALPVIAACLALAALAVLAPSALAEANGLALTPPMGWNDWYVDHCTVSAQTVEQTALTMVKDGLKAAGYDYVNIDDCWMAPSRDAAGNLVPDPTRFPDGIAPVAAYVHSLGMKLGIYEDAGVATCAGYPGSYGYETQDADEFASWGVDYVKYDRCNIPFGDFPGESPEQVEQTLYTRMSDALKATGRAIVFSVCNPDLGEDPWEWASSIGNLWRTTTDIQDNYGSMLTNFEGTVDLYQYARPGSWNDPDLLQIGNGGSSLVEYQSEFSLWSEMAAPLIASTNVAALSPGALAIYENRDVIAVDQDPLGEQGVPVSDTGGLWVLSKKLSDGDRAVLLFNSRDTAATITTSASAVGLPRSKSYRLDNLWSDYVSQSNGTISAYVAPHGVAMFRVDALPKHDPADLPPQIVLALTPASTQIQAGQSTTVWESVADNGTTPLQHVTLWLRAQPGWRFKRHGRDSVARLRPGHRFIVSYSATAPRTGPPIAIDGLNAAAGYDSTAGPQLIGASLGEQVSGSVPAPFTSANTTGSPAAFGTADGALAISARGLGVWATSAAPATDSYAAIYEPGGAAPSSSAQVTVTSDQAGGTSGGAGLIMRNAMTAAGGSPAGVALYVSNSAAAVMAWNASGGQDVDSIHVIPSVFPPVVLRLVRNGASYTGYYSTNGGQSWVLVDTVTLAPNASAADQDVGVFHASGETTWQTTATFSGLAVVN